MPTRQRATAASLRRPLYRLLTAQSPSRRDTVAVVDRFLHWARLYVLTEIRSGRLNVSTFGVEVSDLAVDCIADLFARDDNGRFPVLEAYFESVDLEEVETPVLMRLARRLVFRAVSNGIYARHQETAPNFSRIVRSLKRACAHVDGVEVVRVHRQNVLRVSDAATHKAGVLLDADALASRLARRVGATLQARVVVEAVRDILTSDDGALPWYPITGVARAVLSLHAGCLLATHADAKLPGAGLEAHSVGRYIDRGVERAGRYLRVRYVDTGKVAAGDFDAYAKAVRHWLRAGCLPPEAMDLAGAGVASGGLFESLQRYLEVGDADAYREHHRGRLEYFVRRTKACIVEQIDREATRAEAARAGAGWPIVPASDRLESAPTYSDHYK